jgi:hypothetical protein
MKESTHRERNVREAVGDGLTEAEVGSTGLEHGAHLSFPGHGA